MKIDFVDKNEAVNFINKYHYSKILPRITKYYLGVYVEQTLSGVITLGYGTQPLQTIKKLFNNHDMLSKDYLEIGKMCFLPTLNKDKSFGSRTMSMLVSWIKNNLKDVLFLYTLADGIMGKAGYVYQASNFKYIGSFWTSVYLDNETMEKIHPRSAKKLCVENAEYEHKNKIFWLTQTFCDYKNISKIDGLMFRYIYPLNKKAMKIYDSYESYKDLKNPKDKDIVFKKRLSNGKYESIEQPLFNMNTFEHNHQKPKDKLVIKQLSIFDL